MPLALEDIRVVDFSQVTIGPSCTQLLGDLGADVIKIERIEGELSRSYDAYGFPKKGDDSFIFLGLNRNKRGISLDLRRERGKEIVYRLVEKSDVVVQNFRPGIMENLGFGYDMLKKCNSKIIYASVSAYGLKGPHTSKAGIDLMAQGMSGIMTVIGDPNGPPMQVGAPIADYIGSLLLAQGITTALLVRERFGLGQEIDIALIDTLLPLLNGYLTATATLGEMPIERRGKALYGVYKTKDGYITLGGALQGNAIPSVCSALGLEDLSNDSRFDTRDKVNANDVELRAILGKAIGEKTTSECLTHFEEKDLLSGPVSNFREVVQDPQVQLNNMIVEIDHPVVGKFRTVGNPIRFSETPGIIRRPPPTLGQHNKEVLTYLGYTEDEIGALRKESVIG